MKLNQEQRQKLLHELGIGVTEACDKCGQLLGSIRWTRRSKPGEWCSPLCRDGLDHKPLGVCQSCGASLNGKRKGTRFCSDRCRKRDAKQNGLTGADYRGTAAHSKGVTNEVRGFPYSPSVRG